MISLHALVCYRLGNMIKDRQLINLFITYEVKLKLHKLSFFIETDGCPTLNLYTSSVFRIQLFSFAKRSDSDNNLDVVSVTVLLVLFENINSLCVFQSCKWAFNIVTNELPHELERLFGIYLKASVGLRSLNTFGLAT